MTTQDDLAAGRELDALVAERVMGWQDVHPEDNYDPRAHQRTTILVGLLKQATNTAILGIVPAYSTDIAAAWQTVERLAQMDPPRWLEIGRREHGWTVSVWVHCQAHGDRCEVLDRPVWIDDQETAPLAICRAALAAVR